MNKKPTISKIEEKPYVITAKVVLLKEEDYKVAEKKKDLPQSNKMIKKIGSQTQTRPRSISIHPKLHSRPTPNSPPNINNNNNNYNNNKDNNSNKDNVSKINFSNSMDKAMPESVERLMERSSSDPTPKRRSSFSGPFVARSTTTVKSTATNDNEKSTISEPFDISIRTTNPLSFHLFKPSHFKKPT
jgi:hypothetical protein